MLLVAALVSGCTSLECEIDTLGDTLEFRNFTLEMNTDTHGHCCGIMKQFFKVAASGSQPWKFEASKKTHCKCIVVIELSLLCD